MTTSGSDFDVAKSVADQLKGIEKDRQQRILRWVAESLSLNLGNVPAADGRAGAAGAFAETTAVPQEGVRLGQRLARPTDIKTFVESKRPKSDVQFATVVAYYYQFDAPLETRKTSIDAPTLQDAARLANRRRPPSPAATLNNAKKLGYLDSEERGQFHINSVGENLVAMTLPGGQTQSPQEKARSKKPKKAKPRKAKPRKTKPPKR